MTKRRNFSKAIKGSVIKRATVNGVVYCEGCHLPTKRFEIHHILSDREGGEPVIENAKLLCEGTPQSCHDIESARQAPIHAKLRDIEAKHIGAVKPKGQIKSAGFSPSDKPKRESKPSLQPRQMYEDER